MTLADAYRLPNSRQESRYRRFWEWTTMAENRWTHDGRKLTPPMARLLYEALSRGIAPDYVRRLLAAFPMTEPEQASPPGALAPESELIEPLSQRELKVLQLMAQGLTNREIASRLFLALNTVKTHASSIYGKLGVHSRTQAVARARALGLLPST